MVDLFTPYQQIESYDGGIFEYWYSKFGDNPNPYPLLTDFLNSSNYVDLDTDYHELFSSEKYLSRGVIRMIELYISANYTGYTIWDLLPNGRFDFDDKNDIIQFVFSRYADIIYIRFGYKWKKIYDALTTDYNPLENYNMKQKRTPNITKEDTYDVTDERTPDIERKDTYDITDERTPDITREDEFNTTDTRTPNITTSGEDNAKTEVGIYGFNSTSGNNSTNSDGESSSSETTTGTDTNEKTGTITNTETGTDTTTKSGTITNTESGSDVNTKTGTITNIETGTDELERSGNIGVTTSQQMLESELKLREYDFYKTIYKDIDSILCLGIY